MIEPNWYLVILVCVTFLPHLLMELCSRRPVAWACESLAGHVILFGLSWACLVSPVFLYLSHRQGTLTPVWGADMVAVCAMGGIAAGVLCWYLISQPHIRKSQ
ncbi:MAG TPA: hypothetical protein VGM16_02520, partial [Gammaproteobacteria bacterium]